jgi:anti-anti-sigma regulatory factor
MRTHVRWGADGGAVVGIAGKFDTPDVEQLSAVTQRCLESRGAVTLDFHGAEVLSDCAIARLAHELERAHGHVSLMGLSEHHHRLLQYMGAEAPRAGHAGAEDNT